MAIRLLASQNLTENEVLNLISDNKDSKGKKLTGILKIITNIDLF